MADFYFQLKDLAVGYHGNPLIRDINIGIDKGEIVTLIGPNGSGKTTTIKLILKRLWKIYDFKKYYKTVEADRWNGIF